MNTFVDSGRTALELITSLDPALWTVVARSLAVSATACALGYGVGVVAGAVILAVVTAVQRLRGKRHAA